MTLLVYTANRVSDGVVVFLAEDDGWLEIPRPSGVIRGADMEMRMKAVAEAAEEAAIVVSPYPIEVTDEGGEIRPVSLRERIRAYGPSIHPEFAKQWPIADKGY
ncbi:MAG: DUF2849 domain-containing protein [Proteobacteria bacterium]|nr:DUF2849 domain-containing protein [Pseudomonadota bacterium]